MPDRIAALRAALAPLGLDALWISGPENRRYLSGFTGSAGTLTVTPERALLATDFRYYEQVRQQAPAWELVEVGPSTIKTLAEQASALGLRRIGFESAVITVDTYDTWRAELPSVEWVPTKGLVEGLRAVKDADELAAIEEAVRIADDAMQHIMGWIRPGVTEAEIAWELEVHMRTHGAEKLAFNLIVGAGPNGAMSHAIPGPRAVQVGDPIVIDMGAMVRGYCSDLTRSFCLGRASDDYRKVWRTVLDAQRTAERGIRAGLPGKAADALARDLIYGAGYEGQFGHGLGHSAGLAIHEDPRASMTSEDTLVAGNILTVEPGIYDPAWGGVRIEDMVLVQEGGCRVLTQCPKVPIIG